MMQEYQKLHETKEHSHSFFPYNTYICTIPLDFVRVSPHWHDDVELIVIKSGQGIVNVDASSYEVVAGDIVIVRPGQIHSIYQKDGQVMEYENIIFKMKLLYSPASDACTIQFFETYFNLKYDMTAHIHQGITYGDELRRCVNCIDEYCRETPANYQIMVKSYLYQFFFICSKYQKKSVLSDMNKRLGKIKEAILYVEEHYKEEITVESVAKELGFSASHFMKIFKKNMHVTFITYLNDYRLNRASELLRTTDGTVVEIMAVVGFNNLSYFNRIFKEYYRMTPREYRSN